MWIFFVYSSIVFFFVFPAVVFLWGVLYQVWNIPYGEQISITLAGVQTALGILLGITKEDNTKEIYPYIDDTEEPIEQKAIDLTHLVSLLHNKTTFYKVVDNFEYKDGYLFVDYDKDVKKDIYLKNQTGNPLFLICFNPSSII